MGVGSGECCVRGLVRTRVAPRATLPLREKPGYACGPYLVQGTRVSSHSLRVLSFAAATVLAAACTDSSADQASAEATPQAAVDELLATDRAFAAAADKADVAGALGPMFADDVVMPVPPGRFAMGATAAIQALRSNPAHAGARIEWAPIRGGVSADGQHGFTFGYMTLHRPDSTPMPLKYMAYWVKRPEGWRVAAYKRARRGAGDAPTGMMEPALPPRLVEPTTDSATIARFRASLDSAERAFSDSAQQIGLGAAFTHYGSPDAVNVGGPDDSTFIVGAEAIGRAVGTGMPTNSSPVSWAPDRVIVSSSGDLGVTIGYIRPNGSSALRQAAGIPFFTIWRRATPDDPWRYVAE